MRSWQWTDAALERMRELVAAGTSAGQTAAALSVEFGCPCSRNAVIGKLARLEKNGFPQLKRANMGWNRKPGGRADKAEQKAARGPQAAKPRSTYRIAPRKTPREQDPGEPAVIRPEDARAYDAASRHLTMKELERNDGLCRWPVNDAAPGESHRFCGHPAEHGMYCRHHHDRSIGAGTLSERDADRQLARAA